MGLTAFMVWLSKNIKKNYDYLWCRWSENLDMSPLIAQWAGKKGWKIQFYCELFRDACSIAQRYLLDNPFEPTTFPPLSPEKRGLIVTPICFSCSASKCKLHAVTIQTAAHQSGLLQVSGGFRGIQKTYKGIWPFFLIFLFSRTTISSTMRTASAAPTPQRPPTSIIHISPRCTAARSPRCRRIHSVATWCPVRHDKIAGRRRRWCGPDAQVSIRF